MRRLFFTFLFIAGFSPAIAAAEDKHPWITTPQGNTTTMPAGPVTLPPSSSTTNPDKLTIAECLSLLSALNALDGRRVIVAAGKPTESVETIPYKFGSSPDRAGKIRGAISHNIFVLIQVQQEAQAANRREQLALGKGDEIKPGSKEAIEFDRRMTAYTERPCNVALDHIPEADLRVGENDLPGSVLALLWKVIDR